MSGRGDEAEPDPRAGEYLIVPLDHLSIQVWKNQELSGEYAVRPDGIVTVPLLIMVLLLQKRIIAGLTAGAVKG